MNKLYTKFSSAHDILLSSERYFICAIFVLEDDRLRIFFIIKNFASITDGVLGGCFPLCFFEHRTAGPVSTVKTWVNEGNKLFKRTFPPLIFYLSVWSIYCCWNNAKDEIAQFGLFYCCFSRLVFSSLVCKSGSSRLLKCSSLCRIHRIHPKPIFQDLWKSLHFLKKRSGKVPGVVKKLLQSGTF